MTYRPTFSLTPPILSLLQNISHTLGYLEGEKLDFSPNKLRRENNIKTIQSSLAIEGNTLSLDQVNALFQGKRVIGPQNDIIEVQNAILLYEKFDELNPNSMKDFLRAHKILMKNLVKEHGKWRDGNVGIFDGSRFAQIAPSAKRVPILMKNLFEFIKTDREVPQLIKACVFHYELEFIHPFVDGNGRMGRLWQHLLLTKENLIFKFITVEELIKNNQRDYYKTLAYCDKVGNSTQFIEFSLQLIYTALQLYRKSTTVTLKDAQGRLQYAKSSLKNNYFSRRDYMDIFKDISTATASRDLRLGVEEGILLSHGSKNQSLYCYK